MLEELASGVGRSPVPKDVSSAAGVRRRCANIFKAEVKAALANNMEEVSSLIASVPSIVAQEICNFLEKSIARDHDQTKTAPVDGAPEEPKEVAPELTGPRTDPCLHR